MLQSSVKLSNILLRSRKNIAPLREKPPPEATFLEYTHKPFSVENAPGFGHQICNLLSLVEEARQLSRIPILPPVVIPPGHNNGIAACSRFNKYLSFSGLLPDVDVLNYHDAREMDFSSSIEISAETKTATLQGNQAQLVVREFTNWNYFDVENVLPYSLGSKDGTSRRWLNTYAYKRIRPSFRVRQITSQILRTLPEPLTAIHVRRGDRLINNPHWDQMTRPENIIDRIKRWAPAGKSLYVLTNEKDTGFFDSMKSYYDIKTSTDFPVLRQLVEEEQDNFMLFAIEMEIMKQAAFCISTEFYKGPVLTPYSLMGPADLPKPSHKAV